MNSISPNNWSTQLESIWQILFAKLITVVEIKSSFLVFLITSDVLQDDEFMQRKEKAIKTVTDIFVSK